MYFNLNELPIAILKKKKDYCRKKIVFSYDDKIYYYKEMLSFEYLYNEVIAEKIATQANIACAHYHLGRLGHNEGIISESISLENYHSMLDFLEEYHNGPVKLRNTFENIWQTFDMVFDESTTERLMDKLVDIFLFDVIIGNPDRNLSNYGIIIADETVEFAPLIDNEFMVYEKTINDGYYDLRCATVNERQNMLYYFLDISDEKYQKRLLDLLPLISEKNLKRIFWELEIEGISIPIDIKLKLLKKFAINRLMIEKYFQRREKTYKLVKN